MIDSSVKRKLSNCALTFRVCVIKWCIKTCFYLELVLNAPNMLVACYMYLVNTSTTWNLFWHAIMGTSSADF